MRIAVINLKRKKGRIPGRIEKYVHRQTIKLWKDATKVFIDVMVQNMGDNIDTGMSIASLMPLSGKVGVKSSLNTLIRESIKGKGPKRGHTNAYGVFANNNAKFKSRALGERLGRQAYVLKFGTPNRVKFEFEFKIVVLQHYLNENGIATVGPWNSLEEAKEAFLAFWHENYSKYIEKHVITHWLITGEVLL